MVQNEFIEKWPTGRFRKYSPDWSIVVPVLQQEFYCRDEYGRGYLWLEPEPEYRTPPQNKEGQP